MNKEFWEKFLSGREPRSVNQNRHSSHLVRLFTFKGKKSKMSIDVPHHHKNTNKNPSPAIFIVTSVFPKKMFIHSQGSFFLLAILIAHHFSFFSIYLLTFRVRLRPIQNFLTQIPKFDLAAANLHYRLRNRHASNTISKMTEGWIWLDELLTFLFSGL